MILNSEEKLVNRIKYLHVSDWIEFWHHVSKNQFKIHEQLRLFEGIEVAANDPSVTIYASSISLIKMVQK